MTTEERIAKLEAIVDGLKEDVHEMRADVRALRTMAENARGGWWALTVIGGLGTVIGGLLVKFVPVLGKG